MNIRDYAIEYKTVEEFNLVEQYLIEVGEKICCSSELGLNFDYNRPFIVFYERDSDWRDSDWMTNETMYIKTKITFQQFKEMFMSDVKKEKKQKDNFKVVCNGCCKIISTGYVSDNGSIVPSSVTCSCGSKHVRIYVDSLRSNN